jgi:uncharacterized protein (DUF1697 family)
MEHLRTLFAELGFASVETFIATGNVIFGAPKEDARILEARIATHLRQALGYDVATFVRFPSQLAAVADCRPFPTGELDASGVTLTIAFLSDPPEAEAQRALMAFRSTVNDFHVHGREVYWLCRTRTTQSGFSGALLEKAVGMPTTLRNANTVRRIAALLQVPD